MTPRKSVTIIAMTGTLLLATAAANGSILLASFESDFQGGCNRCSSSAITFALEGYSPDWSTHTQLGMNYPLWTHGDSGTYVFHAGDGPDFWNTAELLTNGIDDTTFLIGYVGGYGGGGSGGPESLIFGTNPDLIGNQIDYIQLTVQDVYIEPYGGNVYTGAHVTYEIWGQPIPEPTTLGLILLTVTGACRRRSRMIQASNKTLARAGNGAARTALLIATIVTVGLAAESHAGLPAYRIEGLGTNLGPADINNNGDIIVSPYLYRDGTFIDLGIGALASINNLGAITGVSDDCRLFPAEGSGGAFYYENGVKTCIEGFIPHSQMMPWKLNDAGQVIGFDNRTSRSFIWSDGVSIDLDISAFFTWAHDINNKGQVLLGESVWEAGTLTPLGFYGTHMNDAGQIITAQNKIWQDGVFTEMGQFVEDGYDSSNDLNNLGQIVGESFGYRNGNFGLYQWLWTDGTYHLLDDLLPRDSGWRIYDARAINDLGQIVGRGDHNGVAEAFVMTPVPEPLPIAMLLGSMAIKRSRRNQKRQSTTV
jgi:uncharacterized membrane protein